MLILRFVLAGALTLSLSLSAWAATEIIKVEVSSALIARAQGTNPAFPVETGSVIGKVIFKGEAPVYVTLLNGPVRMTTLTDPNGNFSFYFLLGAYQYSLEAWAPQQQMQESVKIHGTLH